MGCGVSSNSTLDERAPKRVGGLVEEGDGEGRGITYAIPHHADFTTEKCEEAPAVQDLTTDTVASRRLSQLRPAEILATVNRNVAAVMVRNALDYLPGPVFGPWAPERLATALSDTLRRTPAFMKEDADGSIVDDLTDVAGDDEFDRPPTPAGKICDEPSNPAKSVGLFAHSLRAKVLDTIHGREDTPLPPATFSRDPIPIEQADFVAPDPPVAGGGAAARGQSPVGSGQAEIMSPAACSMAMTLVDLSDEDDGSRRSLGVSMSRSCGASILSGESPWAAAGMSMSGRPATPPAAHKAVQRFRAERDAKEKSTRTRTMNQRVRSWMELSWLHLFEPESARQARESAATDSPHNGAAAPAEHAKPAASSRCASPLRSPTEAGTPASPKSPSKGATRANTHYVSAAEEPSSEALSPQLLDDHRRQYECKRQVPHSRRVDDATLGLPGVISWYYGKEPFISHPSELFLHVPTTLPLHYLYPPALLIDVHHPVYGAGFTSELVSRKAAELQVAYANAMPYADFDGI